jgi:hypothetical protein
MAGTRCGSRSRRRDRIAWSVPRNARTFTPNRRMAFAFRGTAAHHSRHVHHRRPRPAFPVGLRHEESPQRTHAAPARRAGPERRPWPTSDSQRPRLYARPSNGLRLPRHRRAPQPPGPSPPAKAGVPKRGPLRRRPGAQACDSSPTRKPTVTTVTEIPRGSPTRSPTHETRPASLRALRFVAGIHSPDHLNASYSLPRSLAPILSFITSSVPS